jgi:hypothetical protein
LSIARSTALSKSPKFGRANGYTTADGRQFERRDRLTGQELYDCHITVSSAPYYGIQAARSTVIFMVDVDRRHLVATTLAMRLNCGVTATPKEYLRRPAFSQLRSPARRR